MTIGKLTRVALREVWKHEAHDFTVWLEENTDVLNEVLDFNLVSAEREKAAGDFNVDLVGEDEHRRTVVIENQLEKSDHDHLGKVLTYLAALDAKAAVWKVSKARTSLHGRVSPSTDNWIGTGAGRTGVSFEYIVRQHETQVRLYFNTGDPQLSSRLFASIEAQKEAVEEQWPEVFDQTVDAMIRFEKALEQPVKALEGIS